MPQLLLIRHAKAEAPTDVASDHERALTLAGRGAATALGAELRDAGLVPDVLLVSSALRTQQTWKLMSSALETSDVRTTEDLYETHVAGVLEILAALEGEPGIVAVVGHEPTMSATAAYLAGSDSDTPSLQRIAQGLPTGTAAVLEFEGAWADLAQRSAVLTGIYATRALY
jgi:phosphohistidine phosphatase